MFSGVIIGYFLYGNSSEELESRLNDVVMMRKMETEPASFWQGLVQSLMIDQNHVIIRGKPSKELMEKMGKEEKERVAKQREALGEISSPIRVPFLSFRSVCLKVILISISNS